jgi:hypothetical protein
MQEWEPATRLSVKIGKLKLGAQAQTVLIASHDRDASKRWHPRATGFPYYVNGRVFIATAAHGFLGLSDEPVLLIGPNGQVRLFRDRFKLVGSTAIDLALIALASDDLLTLFGECVCVEPDMHALPGRTQPHAYQVVGFPASKNAYSKTKGWPMAGWRVTLGLAAAVPPRSKLDKLGVPLLAFNVDLKTMVNDEGEPDKRLGALKGMSGGPVISHALGEHTMGPGMLAGVFLEWHSDERVAVVMPAMGLAAAVESWDATGHL